MIYLLIFWQPSSLSILGRKRCFIGILLGWCCFIHLPARNYRVRQRYLCAFAVSDAYYVLWIYPQGLGRRGTVCKCKSALLIHACIHSLCVEYTQAFELETGQICSQISSGQLCLQSSVFILFEEDSCPESSALVHWESSLVASKIFWRLRRNVQIKQRWIN